MPIKKIISKKRIYLDYAAAAPVLPAVLKVSKKWQRELFGNPSSIHKDGVRAKRALQESRILIAKHFDAHDDEIIFTSGGTESNALAILGSYWKAIQDPDFFAKKVHIVTTTIEHPSVLKTCEMLEKEGVEVTYVPVDASGLVSPSSIADAVRPETVLVSIAYANSEIGVVQPIKEIAKEIRRYKKNTGSSVYPLFHVDACQAVQYLDIGVERLGVDLMSWNGTKIGGPRGTGVLYIKRTSPIAPLYVGGGQEYSMRSGTENVPAIVGLSIALTDARTICEKECARLLELRDFCVSEIIKKFPDARINGDMQSRLPNNINVSFKNFSSELLVLELDAKGISVSAGSACESSKDTGSHVLTALYGAGDEKKWGSVRFSLGRETKKQDIEYTLKTLALVFEKYKKTGIL